MAKLLLDELGPLDRAHLAALTMQPGWPIIVKMFEQACSIATTRVIQLSPEDANYNQKLANAQINARATHDFCASVLKSIAAHCTAVGEEREAEKEAVESAKKIVATFRNTVAQQ